MELNELPGSELILPGLEDLHDGRNMTIGALLIAIASIRLAQAGLEIPNQPLAPDPELTLYAQLQGDREDAYADYNALLNSLNSFCNALELKFKIDQSIVTPSPITVPAHPAPSPAQTQNDITRHTADR
jgi:hypothetical protein